MVCLHSKHFGDKVFFSDLNDRVINEILKIPQDIHKIPNFGILGRFDNGTVGLFVWYVGKYGRILLLREPSTHKTIDSWARFHTSSM